MMLFIQLSKQLNTKKTSIFCGIFLAYGRVIAMIDKNEYNVNDHHLKQFLQAQELFFIVGIILFGIFISLMSVIALFV